MDWNSSVKQNRRVCHDFVISAVSIDGIFPQGYELIVAEVGRKYAGVAGLVANIAIQKEGMSVWCIYMIRA